MIDIKKYTPKKSLGNKLKGFAVRIMKILRMTAIPIWREIEGFGIECEAFRCNFSKKVSSSNSNSPSRISSNSCS